MNDTVIYYFSATGNSLYAAKLLSETMENAPIISMLSRAPENEVGGPGCSIGFVFPVYYGKLPRLVKNFIAQLKIEKDTYCFAVVTSGAPGFICGGVLSFIDELLQAKGTTLSYGEIITMQGNYVIEYGAPTAEKIQKKVAKASLKVKAIAADIGQLRRNKIKRLNFASDSLYKDIPSLDQKFFVEAQCNGCGICEQICPVQNIKLIEEKPVWQHHCEHCVACIQWCPQTAIQYGDKTKKRKRYQNPYINMQELIAEDKTGM